MHQCRILKKNSGILDPSLKGRGGEVRGYVASNLQGEIVGTVH